MINQISNGLLTARINHKGAELVSLYNQATNLEHMWNADPRFWAKTSPLLFPIVGALLDNAFSFRGVKYQMPRHGFARDSVFELEKRSASKAVFLLKPDEEILKNQFPFPFELRVSYALTEFELTVTYEVTNTAPDEMYFSIGGHPAFKIPLVEGTSYEDYYLKFQMKELSDRWPISKNGLIEPISKPFMNDQDKLFLKKEMFYNDALVFKDLRSSSIAIRTDKHTHGIEFRFDGFPYFGIWAFPDSDFVCLEPWCGIADSVTHDQVFENKEGINKLSGGGIWSRSWSVNCF